MTTQRVGFSGIGIFVFVLILGLLSSSGAAAAGQSGPAPLPQTLQLVQDDACGNDFVEVPDRGTYFDFHDACVEHDACYAAGGSAAQRRACDNAFLSAMQAYCNATYTPREAGYYHCHSKAKLYYAGVRLGGWLFF
jgi:hypothetical protein